MVACVLLAELQLEGSGISSAVPFTRVVIGLSAGSEFWLRACVGLSLRDFWLASLLAVEIASKAMASYDGLSQCHDDSIQ